MSPSPAWRRTPRRAAPRPAAAAGSLTVHELGGGDRQEALAFLGAPTLPALIMAGFIRDNGVVSPLNRGTFYGCRGRGGRLEAVALIGHHMLVEARSHAALSACACLAQGCRTAHVIMGERGQMGKFWGHYAGAGQSPRLLRRELLLEQRQPVALSEPAGGLRLATADELRLVMPLQAEMAFEESGVNPLESDPEGFERRCARRIAQGRVWVWVERGRVIFKADVISATPQAYYLEGVYTRPDERRKGYGLRCLSQLGRTLLGRTGALRLLVNERNLGARHFYRRAGYGFRGNYDTIFLQR